MMIVGFVVLAVIVAGFVLSLAAAQRRGEAERPRTGWTRTNELFKDPTTGRVMRVWLDPSTGSRHYIPER